MKHKIKIFTCLFTLLFSFHTFIPKVSASDEVAGKGNGASFSVAPVYPKNQLNDKNGYFELRVAPKQKQTLSVKVTNYSDKEIVVNMTRNRATTSDAGITSYKDSEKKKDKSIQTDFNDIVSLQEKKVVLKAKKSKEIKVNVAVPDNAFTGQVLGGIHFSQEVDDQPTKESDPQTIRNTFSYSIAILLTENDKKVENQLQLLAVKADQRNYRNFIESTLQNSAPMMIKNMSIDVTISKKGSEKTVYQSSKNDLRMAPNSSFNFGVDLKDTKLIAGDYHLKMKAIADGKEYSFTKVFTISKEEAQKLNQDAVYLDEEGKDWTMYIVTGVIALMILIGLILFVRNRRKRQRSKA